MARKPRTNDPGTTYHVMNRGNRKAVIFEDERDRKRFLHLLIEAERRHEVELLAGCQQHTHFHLVVHSPHGNLPSFMQCFEGEFAQYSNWRHKRVGHLFQGPYRGVVIEDDVQLVSAVCYVFANPIESGLVDRPEDWKWSTYAASAGFTSAPSYLSLDWMEQVFPASTRAESQQQLRALMRSPQPTRSYLELLERTGNASFGRALRSYVGDNLAKGRAWHRPTLEELFPSNMDQRSRPPLIRRARALYGYKLAEIARVLGLHPDTVRRMSKRL